MIQLGCIIFGKFADLKFVICFLELQELNSAVAIAAIQEDNMQLEVHSSLNPIIYGDVVCHVFIAHLYKTITLGCGWV